MARRQIEVSNEVAAELAGSHDRILRELEEQLDCDIFLRGNVVTLDGDAEAVATAAHRRARAVPAGRARPRARPGDRRVRRPACSTRRSPRREVLEDVVWRHRNLRVAPKSVNQKRYVDAIRNNTVTFGIGPAGTGKTFLAIAMAVAALSRREVNRIILTRPAVEAGERLGFLPGRPDGEGRPLPAPAVRRAERHARPRARHRRTSRRASSRSRRWPSCAAARSTTRS